MSAKKVIAEFLKVRKEYPNSYALFHARYATHGVKNEENCHPFKVGGDERTYLAHNGILDVDIHATDKRSDTRVFAEDILPSIGGVTQLDNDNVWKILSKWSSGSKIAVLTVDPAATDQCYIINESSGHWDNEGIWWSNDTYKESAWSSYIGMPTTKKYNYLEDNWKQEYTDYECESCGAVPFEESNPYYCEMCLACWDCNGQYGSSCMCFIPEKDQYLAERRHSSTSKGAWYYDGYFDQPQY
jgi:glutamine amidotransferase